MNFLPKARAHKLIVQQHNDETLVYDLSSNKAFCLNETSMTVWQLSDGQRSVEQIATEMSKTLKTIVSEELVLLAIEQLNENHLLEDGYKPNEVFAGLSRRDVIKKVGFASLVALPIVSSLVAPTAAQAQSCLPTSNTNPGGASLCFSNSECCSGHCLDNQSCCNPGGDLSYKPHPRMHRPSILPQQLMRDAAEEPPLFTITLQAVMD